MLLEEGEEDVNPAEVDDTRRFTIKEFKEKAQKFVKDNYDKYNPNNNNGNANANNNSSNGNSQNKKKARNGNMN